MGNTETLLPSRGGGSLLLHGAGHSQVVLLGRTGEAPGLAWGTPCTLLCPSSALFSSFLLKRCFICPQHKCLGLLGGLALAPLWMGVWDGPGCSGGHPLPQPGGFPGSLPTTIPPSRLQECQWEQGPWGMMETMMAARGMAGIQQCWVA